MSLRVTYWGDDPQTMSWMDLPPCGWEVCSASAGDAIISDMDVQPLEKKVVTPAPTPAPALPLTPSVGGLSLHINGAPPGVLAGRGGSVHGEHFTLQHDSGFTLFSRFHGAWEPDAIMQLRLLGKAISFTVDLSKVGCGCNLALYLISMPARDWAGNPSAGS